MLVPALVLLAGLVLPVWAVFVEPAPGVPGLNAFPSAYLGDTLLIPATILVIVGVIRSRAPAFNERALTVAAAGMAGAAAVAVQAIWLGDLHPRVNWTLPRPGYFTAAGWWHAVYFVVMSALAAALTVLAIARVRAERHRSGTAPVAGPYAPVPFMTVGTYLVLVVHDSTAASIGLASGSSLALAAVALALTGGLTVLALGRSWRILLRPALVGLAAAGAGSAFVVGPGPYSVPVIVAVAAALTTAALALLFDLLLLAASSSVTLVDRLIGGLTTAAICGAAWVLLSQELARHDAAATAQTAVGAVLLLTAHMIGFLGREAKGALMFNVLCVGVFAVAATAAWFAAAPATVAAWAPGLAVTVGFVLTGATKGMKEYSELILGVPKEASEHSERLTPNQVGRSTLALVLIGLFALGSLMATLALALASNPGIALPASAPLSRHDLVVCVAAILCVVFAVAIFAVASKATAQGPRWAVWTATVAASLALSALLLADAGRQTATALVTPTAFAAALVAAAWTLNSLVNNLWLLQGRVFGPLDLVPTLSLALLTSSTVLWILTAGTRTDGGSRGLVQALLLALVAVSLMIALVTFFGGAAGRGQRHLTELPPWRNLFQDALIIAAIVLILILPTEYMINNLGVWDGLKLSVPPALLFAAGCGWVMSANRNWPEIEARRLLSADAASQVLESMGDRSWRRFRLDLRTQRTYRTRPIPSEHSEEFIRALGAHTRNQNRIAAVMFTAPLITLVIGIWLLFDSGQYSQMARHLARSLSPRRV
ncbi:hypothetical protein [Actinomadura mexicana]|uniref:hypothetical protein n=1 Tax=Actinomadura mexicana TaxID=134959 RepID=UPI001178C337|nr:hypothetical protein [Actinomadura mexicana]